MSFVSSCRSAAPVSRLQQATPRRPCASQARPGRARPCPVLCKASPDMAQAASVVGQALAEAAAPSAPPPSAAYNFMLSLQQEVLSLAQAATPLAQQGSFSTASADGTAAATVQGYAGGAIRWLCAAGLTNPAFRLETCRLAAFVQPDRGAPHFSMEAMVMGDQVLGIIMLFPRQHLSTDMDYTRKYFGTAPAEGKRCYNDIMNAAAVTAKTRAGWRFYQSNVLELKVAMVTSFAYMFPAQQEDLEAFKALALEAAQLWAAFASAPPTPAANTADMQALDRRLYECTVYADPDNDIAVKLFGQQATDELLRMMIGQALPPSNLNN